MGFVNLRSEVMALQFKPKLLFLSHILSDMPKVHGGDSIESRYGFVHDREERNT